MSRCEEFAYHALVRLAQIRTSGENRLNMRCVARPTSPMPGESGRTRTAKPGPTASLQTLTRH